MRSGYRHAILLLFLALVTNKCLAYDHFVGGQDGWLPNPSEAFDHWAKRNRFQVNDRLVFKYDKEEDTVLEVSKEHYESCNVTNPYLKLEGGNSVFDLARSGPFFFISGKQSNCEKGEKLIVVVLATRRKQSPSLPPSSAQAPRFTSSPSQGDGASPAPPPSLPDVSSSSSLSYSSVLSASNLGFGIIALFLGGDFFGW
ncbi:early nodulin-like protein 3 [Typha latifolia]|uniref:early nodulin-like protein 3 n=1 Tax=Typha latifolia TaxID=4733 RepID=UPI003C2CDD7C